MRPTVSEVLRQWIDNLQIVAQFFFVVFLFLDRQI